MKAIRWSAHARKKAASRELEWSFGKSDIEGKAAMGSGERARKRTITLRDARVKESDEVRPGVIADSPMMVGSLASKFCKPRK